MVKKKTKQKNTSNDGNSSHGLLHGQQKKKKTEIFSFAHI